MQNSYWKYRFYRDPETQEGDYEYNVHPENQYERFKTDVQRFVDEIDIIHAYLLIYRDHPKMFNKINTYRMMNGGFILANFSKRKPEDEELFQLFKHKHFEVISWVMNNPVIRRIKPKKKPRRLH
ncbi:MAG: hypothetical protein LBR15_06395 [Methanobrevibacter sp.]|jgi:hypothetical protein|nr:hypothetical protein [Candidatus Methanovirga australis]